MSELDGTTEVKVINAGSIYFGKKGLIVGTDKSRYGELFEVELFSPSAKHTWFGKRELAPVGGLIR